MGREIWYSSQLLLQESQILHGILEELLMQNCKIR